MSWPSASSATGTIATADPAGVSEPAAYVGRFAPSPTGPLHFGSLLAAVASYLEARRHGGSWLLRIENIDPPREHPGADRLIVQALDAYGFEWDGPVQYQSSSLPQHEQALDALTAAGQTYRCGCSRKDLVDEPTSSLGTIYPGTCRDGTDASDTAIRVRTTSERVEFDDGLQGRQASRLECDSGDFIIKRRDGLIAYHLAVVVDDHLSGITEIVRGIDLMESSLRQIWLQRLLGFRTPAYQHIPVAVNADGSKLSKLTGATALPLDSPAPTLVAALDALGQQPPQALAASAPADIWAWATENWDIGVLAGRKAIPTNLKAMAGDENPLR